MENNGIIVLFGENDDEFKGDIDFIIDEAKEPCIDVIVFFNFSTLESKQAILRSMKRSVRTDTLGSSETCSGKLITEFDDCASYYLNHGYLDTAIDCATYEVCDDTSTVLRTDDFSPDKFTEPDILYLEIY